MEYIANFLYKKGDKKRFIQIIKLFLGGNLVFLLLGYLHYNKYNSPANEAITLFFSTITLVGCNYMVLLSIKSYNHVIKRLNINDSNIKVTIRSFFKQKDKLAVLNKDQISLSKGTFSWNGRGENARGVIIRDRRTKTEYYIIEAYFDEYEELVAQLKK